MSKASLAGRPPRRARRTPTPSLMGPWRITEMELWEPDALDLVGPAQITLEQDGHGHMNFIAVDLLLDYQVARRDSRDGSSSRSRGPTTATASAGAGGPCSRGRRSAVGSIFIKATTLDSWRADSRVHDARREQRR